MASSWLTKVTNGSPEQLAQDAQDFVERAVATASVPAQAILAALAVVSPDDLATPMADGARRLAEVVAVPDWVARLGQVHCDGAWYGPFDVYGDQHLAVLSFAYPEHAEPHVVVVLIDHPTGSAAVDAFVDDPDFVPSWRTGPNAIDLQPAEPAVVAGKILQAFTFVDLMVGARVTEVMDQHRLFVLAVPTPFPIPSCLRCTSPPRTRSTPP